MATAPQDPFNQGGTPPGQPPRQKSNVWLWVLGIVGGLGLLGILICCGSMFAFYRFGTGMLGEQVKNQLQGNPVVQEHVGNIESVDMNLAATAEETQGGNRDVLVFDVQGSKSVAQLAARVEGEKIVSAELIMPDGTRHDVALPGALDEELDIDAGELEIDEGTIEEMPGAETTETAEDAEPIPEIETAP